MRSSFCGKKIHKKTRRNGENKYRANFVLDGPRSVPDTVKIGRRVLSRKHLGFNSETSPQN